MDTVATPDPRRQPSARSTHAWTWALAVPLLATGCLGESPTEPENGRVEPVERPDAVRGIYVNARAAGSSAQLAGLLELVENSVVNTFVIDVKERGEVSWASGVPLVEEVGAGRDFIADLPLLLRTLRDRGIYPIARIVCFYHPVLAEARPEWAIRTSDGGIWLDAQSDQPWVDPYHPDVWAYNIALAREALEAGFAEVQWDYVRFPDVSPEERADMVFPASGTRTGAEGIEAFVEASRTELLEFDAPITADVFGRVITVVGDDGIGAAATPGMNATVRPWLQAFTLGSTTYGSPQMLDQIRAVEDAGLDEWLFWNPDAVYPEGVFR